MFQSSLRTLAASAGRLMSSPPSSLFSSSSAASPMQAKIAGLVKSNKVVVFMKGVPEEPRCGFSNAVVKILEFHGLRPGQYAAHNVLEDELLRQEIKTYSSWPTIPQVYFNGEFIGGCDVLMEMHKSGELVEELKKIGIQSTLQGADGDGGEKK